MKGYALILAALLMTSPAFADDDMIAGDKKKGAALYAKSCTACHGTDVHTRKNRQVKSLPGLQARVNMCNTQLKSGLSDDELTDITKHLNANFYKFTL